MSKKKSGGNFVKSGSSGESYKPTQNRVESSSRSKAFREASKVSFPDSVARRP